ncbi:RNA methyltransferase [Candidatus Margulisiibacteriota bacterium]
MTVYMALLHFPVYNKKKEVVTTCITGFDLHDIARSACTYGIKKYFVVNPVAAQRQFAGRIIGHWMKDESQEFNPTRVEAFKLIDIKDSLKEVVEYIEKKEKKSPVVVATSAKENGTYSYQTLAEDIKKNNNPYLLLFGTGYGLCEEVIDGADIVLEPVVGKTEYNHLSVRSAVAIILDRVFKNGVKKNKGGN